MSVFRPFPPLQTRGIDRHYIRHRVGCRLNQIERFVIGMPDGVEARPDANDVPPIATEFVPRAKADGNAAIATLISEKDLADPEQTPEMAMAIFKNLDDLLGRLQTAAGRSSHSSPGNEPARATAGMHT